MKLLIKFPTRQRRGQFFKILDIYYSKLKSLENTKFFITLDTDDEAMNNADVRARLGEYKNLIYVYGESKNKIHAVNRDMERVHGWDILLLASDDMMPVADGYDQIIGDKMAKHFPDTDGVLWFYDGRNKKGNTLSILGRKYYERFGWIYNPVYTSFACDEEYRVVADLLGKQRRFDSVIIKHIKPPDNKGAARGGDESYTKNYKHLKPDGRLWKRRQKRLRQIYGIK